MSQRRPNRGLTLLETLILLGIFVCLLIMVLPAVLQVREAARRCTCANNLKQWGLATHGYLNAQGVFPPSSGVSRDVDGKIAAVDGWSWMALCLPFLEQQGEGGSIRKFPEVYSRLDLTKGRPLVEPAGGQGTPHANALAASFPGLLCPSFGGSPWADPATKRAAITNYKAMGATHLESLSVASPQPLTPKYPSSMHPDGACFPGEGVRPKDIPAGTSNTTIAVESLEPRWARWTVGAEAAVVALPRNVEFEEYGYPPYVPKGFGHVPHERDEDETDRKPVEPLRTDTVYWTYWTYRPYIDWDYDRQPYDGGDGSQGGKYGPSSNHPGAVNHLLADGSVFGCSPWMDVTIYMLLTCRGQSD